MIKRTTFERSRTALAALAVLAASAGPIARAAEFGVRVVDAAGQPVPGASVCVGLEGNYRQFGALFTDLDGRATVDVPNVPLVVTVSKTRFSGRRMAEPARGFDLVREVRLAEGVPGPRCKAGSTVAEPGHDPILIRDVAVAGGVGAPTVSARVTGGPTHYRIGPDRELEDAAWQRFVDGISVPGSLADEPRVFLQLRRYVGTPDAWLEARSEITEVALPDAR